MVLQNLIVFHAMNPLQFIEIIVFAIHLAIIILK